MPKYGRSTGTKQPSYQRKNAKDNIYRAEWGTRGSKSAKDCTSIAIAKHPLMAWANDVKILLQNMGHTKEERMACLEVLHAIDNVGEFKTGEVVFDIPVPSDGMHFQAKIVRIE